METKKLSLQEDAILLEPIMKTGRRFYIAAAILLAFVLWGVYAYLTQYSTGLGVTGLSRQIFWGVYITNFVFFIGISHAGTFISAVLRVTKAEWRRPITRASELITVIVLFFGVGSVLIDLGRPDRMLYAIRYANFTSPLLWDVCSITTYLTCSSICLYLALIPDIAILRDHSPRYKWLYQILAIGYQGTERQHHLLEKALTFMSILVIPVMFTVHTVVSYVFAMTIQPMWHSAIFGPYFVCGALFSGVAAVIMVMVIIRKFYRLEDYMKPAQFNHLGSLLLALTLLWFYFTLGEFVTTAYGNEPTHMEVFWSKLTGRFAPEFWAMILFCFVIPLPILSFKKTKTITGMFLASISIQIGMWLERFTIIVPTLTKQRLAVGTQAYSPTWVEWSILAGCLSFFMFLYLMFTKFFPIVSVWEMREGREKAMTEVGERLKTYLPDERVGHSQP